MPSSASHSLIYTLSLHDALPIYVVAHDVFASVMLVEASALGAIDDIVLPDDFRTAFVRIQAPAAIGEGVDVVNQIIADDRAALNADRKSTRLNSSHVEISYAVFCLPLLDLHSFPTRRSSDLCCCARCFRVRNAGGSQRSWCDRRHCSPRRFPNCLRPDTSPSRHR